ncbi:MAG: hypothetical protein H6685_08615 [Deltaproteobacteria bacterium]|nr:hypothetical protein [Deltaproteobacteria bacterium]
MTADGTKLRSWAALAIEAAAPALIFGTFFQTYRRFVETTLHAVNGPRAEFLQQVVAQRLPTSPLLVLTVIFTAMLVPGHVLDSRRVGARRWPRSAAVFALAAVGILLTQGAARSAVAATAVTWLVGGKLADWIGGSAGIDQVNLPPAMAAPLAATLATLALLADPGDIWPAAALAIFAALLVGAGRTNWRKVALQSAVAMAAAVAGTAVWYAGTRPPRFDIPGRRYMLIGMGVAAFAHVAMRVGDGRSRRLVIAAAIATAGAVLYTSVAVPGTSVDSEADFVGQAARPWETGTDAAVRSLCRVRMVDKVHVAGHAIPPGVFDTLLDGWWVETDYYGLGRPDRTKPQGAFRIVVQGASATEPRDVDGHPIAYTQNLQRAVDSLNRPYAVEVVNAGIGASTTYGMLVNFRRSVAGLSPDLVVLYLPHSDVLSGNVPVRERLLHALANRGAFQGWNPTVTGRRELAADERRNRRPTSMNVDPWNFYANLITFADEAKRRGVKLLLVAEISTEDLHRHVNLMRLVATQTDASFFDPMENSGECSVPLTALLEDTVHLTPAGMECVGSLIAQYLDRSGLLPPRSAEGETP